MIKKLLLLHMLLLSCGVFAQRVAPFAETFSTPIAPPVLPIIPSSWLNTSTSPSSSALWQPSNVRAVTSMHTDGGIAKDHTGDDRYFIYVRGDYFYSPGQYTNLETEYFSIDTLTNPELSLSIFSYNVTYDSLAPNPNKFSIDFFDGNTWHDSIFTLKDQSVPAWQDQFIDLSAYLSASSKLDSCKIIFRTEASSNQYTGSNTNPYHNIAIDDIRVQSTPNCNRATSLIASNITSGTVDLNWNSAGAGLSYEVEYWNRSTVQFSQGTSTTTGTTKVIVGTNSHSIGNVSSNTLYAARVRVICTGGGYSHWSNIVRFETPCGPITAPYFNDFETYDWDRVDSLPSCWDIYTTVPSNTSFEIENYPLGSYSVPLFFTGGAYRHVNDPLVNYKDTLMVLLPEASDLTAGDKQLSFYLQVPWAYGGQTIKIGTLSSNDPKSSFTLVKSITPSQTSNYYYVVIPFTAAQGYNGTDTQIAIRWEGPGLNTGIQLDDLSYDFIPLCTPITLVDFKVATDSSATFDVDIADPTSKMEAIWVPKGQLFSPSGSISGAGIISGSTIIIKNSIDTTTGNFGLVAGMSYDLYLKNICDNSFYGPTPFTLPCTPFTAPYYNGFESQLNLESDCWTPYANTISSTIYYDIDRMHPSEGFQHIHLNNTAANALTDSIMVISPIFSDMLIGNKQIRFQLYSDDDSIAKYYGAIAMDPEMAGLVVATTHSSNHNEFNVLDTIYPSTNGVYEEVMVQLDSLHGYNGTDNQVVFLHGQESNRESIFIDEFHYELNTCGVIENLTVGNVLDTSATLQWDGGIYNSAYEVWYGPEGFFQGTMTVTGAGSKVVVTADSLVLDTLSGLNCYEYLVRSICTSDTSGWVGPISFCTPCSDALAGTYTIGTSATADFSSFGAAGQRLADCGVSGPVIFNAEPGTYSDTLHLINVQGVSATNTITFNGSGALIEHPATSNTGNTIFIDSTSFVSINKFSIENLLYTNASGIYVSNASHISIDSCEVELDSLQSDQSVIGIVAYNVDTLVITSNIVLGGGMGLLCEGIGSGDFALDVTISNNRVIDYYERGIDLDELQHLQVNNNHIEALSVAASGADGLYIFDANDFSIKGNTITTPDFGLTVNDGNDDNYNPSTRSEIINNMVISTGDDALNIIDVRHVNIYHNTSSGLPGFRINDQEYADVRNNIFTSPSDLAALIDDGMAVTDSMDYNIYYREDQSGNLIDDNGSTYTSLSAWQTANTSININSLEVDPGFVSSTDLHLLGVLANNVGDTTVGVLIDIDGDPRLVSSPLAVDIGADEYAPVFDDLSVIKILGIEGGVCGDSTNAIYAIVSNNGLQAQSNFDVGISVSGGVNITQTVTYSGTLASSAFDTIFISNLNTYGGGLINIKAYTQLTGDQVITNDTLSLEVLVFDKSAPAAAVVQDTICPGEMATLLVPQDYGVYQWETQNGVFVGTGDSISVGPITSPDSTFVLKSLGLYSASDTVGKFAYDIGGLGATAYLGGLRFRVNGAITLDSVKVYTETSGGYVISIVDNSTELHVYGPDTINITGNITKSPIWIELGQYITSGDYRLEGELIDINVKPLLVYDTYGVNYPYTVNGGVLEIYESFRKPSNTPAVNSTSEYRHFYDWQVTIHDLCNRADGKITIYADSSNAVKASFIPSVGNPTQSSTSVTFDASGSAGATTYAWDFGDGSTGTGVNPSHSYTSNGTYTVQLVVDGSCGTDTVTQVITIEGINLKETTLSETLNIYPNPTNATLSIEFVGEESNKASIRLLDMSGREVFKKNTDHVNGSYSTTIDLSGLARGVYMVEVNSGNTTVYKRVSKD